MNVLKSLLGTIAFALLTSPALAQKPAPTGAHSAAAIDSPSELPTKLSGRYAGPWVTTWNKKLDGDTNCIVQQLTPDRWQGRFWGIWQQVPFDYTVEFQRAKSKQGKTAKPDADESTDPTAKALVSGKATIDGASYDWTGVLTPEEFNIKFTGSRYEGHLELTRAKEKPPATKVAAKDRTARKQ
jgi:hypothetical protein